MPLIVNEVRALEIDHAQTGSGMRKLREAQSISLRAASRSMVVSPAYLSDLELGKRNWSDALMKRYEAALAKLSKKAKK